MEETPSSQTVSTKLARVAELARRLQGTPLTTLAHHIDLDWLHEAYRRTRKDGATGIDGQTAQMYEQKLEENLRSLLERAKTDKYRAPAVRRVHIPKGDGTQTRPIGIPTFEDKLLQRAVVMVMETVYEQDFLDCSYGFRPGRSAHDALSAVQKGLLMMGGGWVIELDIEKFFDTLEKAKLQEILAKRIRDGALLRLVGKWLNAGVFEAGEVSRPEKGTPQGGVISPLLANVYLHEVLDVWFTDVVRPRMRGRSLLARYADDAVLVFEREDDARRVLKVLAERFAAYGLKLHPTKTRLMNMKRPDRRPPDEGGGGGATFDLLGFTHRWGEYTPKKPSSRPEGQRRWMLWRRIARDRFSRSLKRLSEWLRRHRHDEVKEQAKVLGQKLTGLFNYFALPGGIMRLRTLVWEAENAWRKWLGRRSGAAMTWVRMMKLLKRYPLPQPKALSPSRRVASP